MTPRIVSRRIAHIFLLVLALLLSGSSACPSAWADSIDTLEAHMNAILGNHSTTNTTTAPATALRPPTVSAPTTGYRPSQIQASQLQDALLADTGPTSQPPLINTPVAAATTSVTPIVKRATAKTIEPPPAVNPAKDTLITATTMKSDPDTNIVTAAGKVEIAHGGYVLHADKVTYNQKTGVMHAEGHVALLTPTGDVEFAQSEDITGDMKQAFANNVGILFPDNSRMAARTIQRFDPRYTEADKASYTACNVCKDNPDNPPLWQLRAKEIVHDNVNHDLYYHDATLDFLGTPVAYTPYMSGPDPSVKRRQGFLSPEPGYNATLGYTLKVPYYFDIAPETDATFAPGYSQKNGLELGGEFRNRFDNGNLTLQGSAVHADLISPYGVNEGNQFRGDLFGTYQYNINNVWRAGADIAFTSDQSYLELYRISSLDQLTNRGYVEGFSGRDYAALNTYYFEDLRVDPQPVQALVLPSATISAYGEPGQTLGGRWSFGADSLFTQRNNTEESLSQQGPDTRKLSLNGGWQREFISSDTGLVSTVTGLARLDNYYADNVVNINNTGQVYNNVLIARPFAQASANLRYPMARNGDGYQQITEPIVAITGAPAFHNYDNQPIENSVDVSFDETNLFAPNRFTGYDLIEGGSRVIAGVRNSITGDNGARLNFFGGESYDFSRDQDFPYASGLTDQQSDYVGRLDFSPAKWADLNYGFRLDHKDYTFQAQDARLSVGAPVFRPYIRYISAYETQTTGVISNDEEAIIGLDSHFAKYWQFHAEHTQNFQPDPGPRTTLASINYIDECFIFGIQASHDDSNRADISTGTSVTFHFFLKNLGGLRTDSFAPTAATYPTAFRQPL